MHTHYTGCDKIMNTHAHTHTMDRVCSKKGHALTHTQWKGGDGKMHTHTMEIGHSLTHTHSHTHSHTHHGPRTHTRTHTHTLTHTHHGQGVIKKFSHTPWKMTRDEKFSF